MEEEITLDVLARMVADGFMAIDNRFESLETEVCSINRRIDEGVIPLLDDYSRRNKDLELAS